MGKLHLGFAAPPRVEPDARRAEMMATRFVEGLKTLDQGGRRSVLAAIGSSFCTRCGSSDPTCRCV